jgi:aldehyde dehydrogenase (NAD+)
MTFRGPEEAIKLANNTYYGLGASVWTENISLALECAVSIKAGTVWVNAHNLFDGAAGFGGYRESGFGRDGGREGLFEYVKPSWQTRPQVTLNFPTTEAIWTSESAQLALPAEAKTTLGVVPTTINRTHKMYYGGKQARPDGNYSRPILSPEGKVLGEVGEGNRKDIRNAVRAAHKAAPGWGKRAAHNRAQICYYLAENLNVRLEEFASKIAAQTGRSLDDAREEVETSIERLFFYAAYADKYGGEVQETNLYGLTCKIHEAVGVIGIACPDEYPLLGFISLVAPALVRGNCVVAIPSPKYPLTACDLYQVLDTSDIPGGVINIITGCRETLTKTLSEHQDIQAMFYFGTQEGSRNVEFAAAQNMKRTWVNYGQTRDWMDVQQGQGVEFLQKCVEIKNIWVPMGELKATGGGY